MSRAHEEPLSLHNRVIDQPSPAQLGAMSSLHGAAFSRQAERGWDLRSMEELTGAPATRTFITMANNEIVAFSLVRAVLDEAEIITVAVAPALGRRGIASQLLDFLVHEMAVQGVARVFLEVRADNLPAQTLYKKAGFKLQGTRKNYYNTIDGNRLDAEVYCLNL